MCRILQVEPCASTTHDPKKIQNNGLANEAHVDQKMFEVDELQSRFGKRQRHKKLTRVYTQGSGPRYDYWYHHSDNSSVAEECLR